MIRLYYLRQELSWYLHIAVLQLDISCKEATLQFVARRGLTAIIFLLRARALSGAVASQASPGNLIQF